MSAQPRLRPATASLPLATQPAPRAAGTPPAKPVGVMITTLGFRLLLFVTLFLVGLKAVPELGRATSEIAAQAPLHRADFHLR